EKARLGSARSIGRSPPTLPAGCGSTSTWPMRAPVISCAHLLTFLPRRASCSLPPTTTNSSMRARPVCSASFPDLVCGLDGITDEIGFLHFAMTESLLVTARHRPLSAIDAMRKALRGGRKVATVAALMDSIVEYVVDAIERYADDVA